MVYMGSKRKYCKDIVPIIQKYIDDNEIEVFIDCFCGGANLTDKIKCETVIANDLSPTLIALHQTAQKHFDLIPKKGSREYWDKAYAEWKYIRDNLKDFKNESTLSLAEIGAIEWYGSFSNGGFPRGYAKPSAGRDYYKEAYRNHQTQASTDNYKKIIFQQGDYRDIIIPKDKKVLLYCDSPYKNTKPYGISPKFNFDEYYDWLRNIACDTPVFISEQNMPIDFIAVWSKEAKRTSGLDNNFKANETLYFIDNRKNL